MTYPPSSPGYPPAPQSGSQYGATQQFAKTPAEPGENKLPVYLLAAAAVMGLVVFLLLFADLVKSTDGFPVALVARPGLGFDAAIVAGLLAGVSLLPKVRNFTAIVAVLSGYSLLMVINGVIGAMDVATWAYWAIVVVVLFQAVAAITALLYETGVLTPPAPKPVFDQQQYGQYGGPSQYYGQQSQPQPGGQPYQQAPPQRPGYPSQYGGYPGQNTGGFPGQNPQQNPQGGQQSGPPTPPTGFPAFGQPQQHQSNASEQTTQVPAQPQAQQPSSHESGQSSS